MRFEPLSAFFLIAMVLLPLIWWRWLQRRPGEAVRFSSIVPLVRQRRGMATRLRHVIPVLRTLAVGLLIVCLARPEKGNEDTRIYAEGIAIQMVVDISGSMENDDFELDHRRATRLEVVKRVFRDFVAGDGEELAGRQDDLIGLIAFARYADSLAPLTLDHENVLTIMDEAQTAEARLRELNRAYLLARRRGDQRRTRQIQAEAEMLQEEAQTAIGDALALGVERLRDLRPGPDDQDAGDSKVIILLTDGQSNAGDLTPEQGAQLAKASGIKIYAIGLDSQRYRGAGVDTEQMREVAESTGGKYFLATSARSLHQVYSEIDQLETVETEERRFLTCKPLAVAWAMVGDVEVPPLLLIVLGLLVVEALFSNTRLRRIP